MKVQRPQRPFRVDISELGLKERVAKDEPKPSPLIREARLAGVRQGRGAAAAGGRGAEARGGGSGEGGTGGGGEVGPAATGGRRASGCSCCRRLGGSRLWVDAAPSDPPPSRARPREPRLRPGLSERASERRASLGPAAVGRTPAPGKLQARCSRGKFPPRPPEELARTPPPEVCPEATSSRPQPIPWTKKDRGQLKGMA
ncbi:WAS/WASL-interacting protein family member 1-like [Perognathus longimembris pacificus]|uniref:WAS/WASL-interacting protein family member 1-like n=1 Tax=Perognathus longimembris pacificus TaxID=214514 RepID=UPI00201863A9|nr:WAS/WASL-interacting protein family member 1-like [Perognathus longimembris pacificus]